MGVLGWFGFESGFYVAAVGAYVEADSFFFVVKLEGFAAVAVGEVLSFVGGHDDCASFYHSSLVMKFWSIKAQRNPPRVLAMNCPITIPGMNAPKAIVGNVIESTAAAMTLLVFARANHFHLLSSW